MLCCYLFALLEADHMRSAVFTSKSGRHIVFMLLHELLLLQVVNYYLKLILPQVWCLHYIYI